MIDFLVFVFLDAQFRRRPFFPRPVKQYIVMEQGNMWPADSFIHITKHNHQ